MWPWLSYYAFCPWFCGIYVHASAILKRDFLRLEGHRQGLHPALPLLCASPFLHSYCSPTFLPVGAYSKARKAGKGRAATATVFCSSNSTRHSTRGGCTAPWAPTGITWCNLHKKVSLTCVACGFNIGLEHGSFAKCCPVSDYGTQRFLTFILSFTETLKVLMRWINWAA